MDKIEDIEKNIGVVPSLDSWLQYLQNLICKINNSEVSKSDFLHELDILVTLFNNGTYYEIDTNNESRIFIVKNQILNLLKEHQWTIQEKKILMMYLKCF